MSSFTHGGVETAFFDEGQGEPIVLVHGFASNKEVNWIYPGWVAALTRAGRRVVALDNRGHGQSSKLYDPAAYRRALMAEDVHSLLDHLGIERADVMGYSMGARIAASLALAHPARVRSAVIGGLGARLFEGLGRADEIARALEAPTLGDVADATARLYRSFAERTHSDLRALAACIRGPRDVLTQAEVATIAVPVLVAVGSNDEVAGSPEGLAALIPGARSFVIPGRDHMLAVGDKSFKAAVLDFLASRP